MAANTPKYTALVMAAGSGTRMHSSVKKQFADLCGMPVVAHCLKAFENNAHISSVVLVVPKGDTETALQICLQKSVGLYFIFSSLASISGSISLKASVKSQSGLLYNLKAEQNYSL